MIALPAHKLGIRLDIGCGNNCQPGYVGMDRRALSGVDIVHDLEDFPWPLDDESCLVIVGSHIIEHIKPWLTINFFNEMWRVMVPDGQLALATPYAGSQGYWQDPTHCNGFVATTFQYFDPRFGLYNVYEPLPWEIHKGYPVWQANGNMEILMMKRSLEWRDEVRKRPDPFKM